MSASTEKKNRQAAREAGTDRKLLASQEAVKRQTQSRRRWTLGSILVILLIAAILFLNSSLLYRWTTAMRIGDRSYSPAELSYAYGMEYQNFVSQYGSYASMFGLDTSTGLAGLGSQDCPMMEDGTWKDYFLDAAKQNLIQTKALTDYAAAEGIALDAAETAQVDESFAGLEEQAKEYGYRNANSMLAINYGSGVNKELARQAQLDLSLAGKAYNQVLESFSYSAQELEDYYQGLEGEQDLFDYAYYYVVAETVEQEAEHEHEDGDEDHEHEHESVQAPTEETLAEAKAKAEAILAAYEESEEEDAELRFQTAVAEQAEGATPYTDTGAQGSYLNSAYKDWLKDARSRGDIILVEDGSETGYYVVLFLDRSDNHYPVAQVRHILIKAEADEEGNYSDEAKAAAKARAEEILAEFESGDKTEESFAALAEQYSEDSGSNTKGGLYDAVAKGQMVPEFDAFCFGGHKAGDTGIVYGESGSYAGYHVMYYVGEGDLYSNTIARNALSSEKMQEWLDARVEGYEATPAFWQKLVG